MSLSRRPPTLRPAARALICRGTPVGPDACRVHTDQGPRMSWSLPGSESGAPGMPIIAPRSKPDSDLRDTVRRSGSLSESSASSADA
nr:hypothetical protein [Actinomadura madurae]